MKIARIVLTAAIVLSLKSTLFGSEKAPQETSNLQRKDSFDALRDGGIFNGWFGYNPKSLANYTIEHCGADYQGKEIRIGSKNPATQAWQDFDNTIKDRQKAIQFLAANKNCGNPLPKKATQIARALALSVLRDLNARCIFLLHEFDLEKYPRITESVDSDASVKSKIKFSEDNRKKYIQNQITILYINYTDMQNIKERTGLDFPEEFVTSKESINEENIFTLVEKYK